MFCLSGECDEDIFQSRRNLAYVNLLIHDTGCGDQCLGAERIVDHHVQRLAEQGGVVHAAKIAYDAQPLRCKKSWKDVRSTPRPYFTERLKLIDDASSK